MLRDVPGGGTLGVLDEIIVVRHPHLDRGIEPVGAPFPHVAGHVVKTVAVVRERADRRSGYVAVIGGVVLGKSAPARCWKGVGHQALVSSPQG